MQLNKKLSLQIFSSSFCHRFVKLNVRISFATILVEIQKLLSNRWKVGDLCNCCRICKDKVKIYRDLFGKSVDFLRAASDGKQGRARER